MELQGQKTITAAYTIDPGDYGFLLIVDSGSDLVITAPATSAKAIPPGFWCNILRKGAGAVTMAAGSGATVNRRGQLALNRNAVAKVSSTADSVYFLESGDYRPYKVYTALLTQASTAAPVATVLENTLSAAIVWARTGAGAYTGTLTGAFTSAKTAFSSQAPLAIVRTSANVVTIAAGGDDALADHTLEIRVYD